MKTIFSWFLVLFGLYLCIVGTLAYGGRRRHKDHDDDDHHKDDHDDDDDDDKEDEGGHWNPLGGIAALFFIGAVVCGIVSLFTWVSCMCYRKVHKTRIQDSSVINMSSRGSDAPAWSALLYYKIDIAGTGIGAYSKGLELISANQLVRTGQGENFTDGAKWSVGMVTGKHVFEITWAWGNRGKSATIGIGTADAPIRKRGSCSLVGGCSQSWGLDIVSRKALHNGKFLATCPTDGSYVPDKFLLYVDMDHGTAGFGNGVTYWGQVISNLPINASNPLYVMIGTCKPGAEISVVYKGSEGGEFATIASSYALPPMFGTASPQKPPPYQSLPSTNKEERPDSAGSQVINVEACTTSGSEPGGYEPPPPYCSPPPGYEPKV